MMKFKLRGCKGLLHGLFGALLSTGAVMAQNPTSVDIRMIAAATPGSLEIQARANGDDFGDVVSNLTFTIRWATGTTASLGTRSSDCPGALPGQTAILDNPNGPPCTASGGGPVCTGTPMGFKYRTYNLVMLGTLDDEGCPWPADTWVTIMRVATTSNPGCTVYTIEDDAYTNDPVVNRKFFVSLGGVPKTGVQVSSTVNVGSCTTDCNGVVGGPAVAGTACNDNNACTINDVYAGTFPNCTCAGTFQDTDGDGICNADDDCPNVAGEIGSTCNDNNACTINDVLNASCQCAGTFQDTDGDGICNADDDCPNVTGEIGSTCNDNNACTINDVLNASCQCVGTFQDTDGDGICNADDDCPNVTGEIGSTCNDNNACTINDVLNASCQCVGTFQDTDGDGICNADDDCPNVTGEIGSTCSDGNACTINDVLNASCQCVGTFQDSDGDGVCDANDQCPGGPEPGTACNDGNAATTGDVIQANCTCAGVLGCTPGAPCNDFNACTTGEVFDGNCNCGGGTTVDPNDNNPCTLDSCDPVTGVSNVFQDADGDGVCDANDQCPGGPEPGTTCNDNNACTINDVIGVNCQCAGTFQDTDGDGTCDANDVCPGGPEPGTACNDNNAATTGDVIQANCVCAGVLGCTPGTPCNDFNACTTGEVFDANCNCGGGVAVDPNDNNPCTLDSCDPVTGVSNVFQDADGDGTCDANDQCPGGPEPGTACDDNNAATTGDVIQANCVCAGVLGCTPGAPCNDFNACTTGEVFDANCNCGGGTAVDPNDNNPCTLDSCDPVTGVSNVFQDADGDGTCDANDVCPNGPEPGTQCDDGNPNTSGDVVGLNCQCSGTFANDCSGVPGGPDQPGTPCDDGDATTGLDTWNANCVCIGLPIDCEGVPGGSALPGTTCNDANACTINDVYDVNCNCAGTFQDSDGDGICNADDDCPNVTGEIGSPCDDLNPNTTGDVLNANCQCQGTPIGGCTENLTLSIKLDGNPGETTWALYNEAETTVILSGGPFASNQANTTVTENICVNVGCYHLRVSDSGNNGITGGGYVLRDAASRRIIDASVGSFTSVSHINTGVSPNRSFCVPVSNVSMLSISCDRTNILITSPIYCNGQPGASGYQFWIYDPHGTYNRRVLKTTNSLVPASLITSPVPTNVDLNVRVRPLVGGDYLPFGPACRIRFRPNPPATAGRDMDFSEVTSPVMTIFPNPNRDGQLTVSMEGLSVEDATTVDVDIYDLLGKRVVAERATAADGHLNHRMDLAGQLGTGLYMVNVTIDGQLYTQRLVMQ